MTAQVRTANDTACKRLRERLAVACATIPQAPQEWNPPRSICACGTPITMLSGCWFHDSYESACNNARPED